MIGDRETLRFIRDAVMYRSVVMGRDAFGREVKEETRLFDKANELLSKIEDLQYHLLHESHLEVETRYDISTMEHKVTAFVNATAKGGATEQERLYAGGDVAIRHRERVALVCLLDCLAKPVRRETLEDLYNRKTEEMIDRMRRNSGLTVDPVVEATEEKQSGQS